ncbi:NUDIX hydrolase [Amycolatopsis sp. K13G38]|uniref:NUDIX hydrolase n=1 Tax=Amycolatopsis acididurans TaxID=2724524 RepID=A0ABX1JDG3_9PSEU|nr:NUDIX hydrolase [Amycolatopsis acididurans]NKQ56302.1 NUDIX hydrolase [Amycolatopsis acididurans]
MSSIVRAAGAVLWRNRGDGVEVAVVHRPRYDDWSLPKGKLDPGETLPFTAVRELHEETGYRAVLGRHLKTVRYQVAGGPKVVEYHSAAAVSGSFVHNGEVDDLRWLPVAAARELLSYPADAEVLDAFEGLPAALSTLLLVRHAKAGKREEWNGDDDLRPLSPAGQRQANAVRAFAPLFGANRVYSVPRLRCVQTVQGIADDLSVDPRHEPLLSEEDYWRDPARGLARLLAIVAAGGTPVVCSQGGVIPDVVAGLAEQAGVRLPAEKGGNAPSKKGSVWVLSFSPGESNGGPHLVAADYYSSALPHPAPTRSGKRAQ